MQRHDRGFRQGTDQDKHDGDTGEPAARCDLDQFGQVVRATHLAEDDDADQHGQTTRGGDEQRLRRRPATRRAFGVMPDQQEGQDRRQFPEYVQQQHVVAGDEAEHGPGEGHHLGGEDAEAGFVVGEVACAVDQDERADAQHQHRHDRGERIEPEVEVHRQARSPLDGHGLFRAPVRDHPSERRQRDEGERVETIAAELAHHKRSQNGGNGMGEQNSKQKALRRGSAGGGVSERNEPSRVDRSLS